MAGWIDRAAAYLAPRWYLARVRARAAAELVQRHYDAASGGRRTQGWRRSLTDVNLATGPYLGKLRDIARDLVRNNPYAEAALSTIVDHAVGWGITGKPTPANEEVRKVWAAWADSTACDADGQHDFAGLQKLVMRTVAEAGEVLVRRRLRRPEDKLPIPLQLQVLEPDFLDSLKTDIKLPNGGRILYGVEYDPIGRRIAYWLFPEHPGSFAGAASVSRRIGAEEILHVFRTQRPGQTRGVTWFAPVLLRFKDFDELEDAILLKQKVAACLAVITSDEDGSAAPLGTPDSSRSPETDMLEPGAIINVPPGRSIEVVQPPAVREYPEFSETVLRAIASGLGVTHEDLTGNFKDMPFSAARMSRLRHWARVDDWRWNLLIPQFCDPVWKWAMQAAAIAGQAPLEAPQAEWTAPPMPMVEPDKEGLAYQRNIRGGIMTLSEAIRERGYDPDALLQEMADDWKKVDELKLVLDCDPRRTTQAGQTQAAPVAPAAPAAGSPTA